MRASSTIALTLAIVTICEAATPLVRFAWKEIDYTWDTPADKENAIKDKIFVPEHNLPLGLARWKNKLFVTVPRWKNGVASSLNYVDVDGPSDQLLKPYPSWKDNLVSDTAKELPSNSSIISVFRVFVDACDRLWVMDSGLADILGKAIDAIYIKLSCKIPVHGIPLLPRSSSPYIWRKSTTQDNMPIKLYKLRSTMVCMTIYVDVG